MNLYEIIYAPTRPAWTARLVLYIAIIATISAAVQVLTWLFV